MPVENDFVDIDTLLSRAQPGRAAMTRGRGRRRARACCAQVVAFALELWDVLRRPSSVFSLGVLVLAGFVAGVIFWGGFNTALELTNTEKFCTSCHEMRDNVFEELKIDDPLHQPLRRARDLPGLPRPARLDRQDRAQDAGLEGGLGPHLRHDRHARKIPRAPARARAARMGAAEGERLARMPQLPQRAVDGHHQAGAARRRRASSASCSRGEKTCIDCHKGIAHRLPDMRNVPGWQ